MSVLRALRQVTASSSRAVARPVARTPLRLATMQLAPRASMTAARAFSVSTRCFSEGSGRPGHASKRTNIDAHLVPLVDVVLSQKLAEELKYEKEADSTEPEFLTTFKAQKIWEVRVVT